MTRRGSESASRHDRRGDTPDAEVAAESPDDPLPSATLIYVAPRSGTSGVSDYADDMLREASTTFGRVVEVRHGASGQDSFADAWRVRARIAQAIAENPGPVVLHTEQSGGVISAFWGLTARGARAPRVVRSATLHDAPLSVWLPFRSRSIARHRLLIHAIHYPLLPLLRVLERRVMRDVHLSALTASGAAAIRDVMRHDDVAVGFLPPPPKPDILPAPERPLAVGLFGYVYRGKGFDALPALRESIRSDIGIRVAGRGTEQLPPHPGVEILGAVEGADEDAFFAGIRAILLPYHRQGSYGPPMHVASSVIARALAYGTPVIALRYSGLGDEADVIDGGAADLAAAVNRLVADDEVARMAERSLRLRAELTPAAAFARIAEPWRDALRTV